MVFFFVFHLNFNSLNTKLGFLVEAVRSNIAILPVSTTKLGKKFPVAKFSNEFNAPFMLDRDCSVGNKHNSSCYISKVYCSKVGLPKQKQKQKIRPGKK